MPELPEMENYKNLLTQKIGNKTITGAIIHREKSINLRMDEFLEKVINNQIKTIERRAKFLLFHLRSGHILLLHLMLGGWMFYGTKEEKPDHTVQVQLSFGNEQLYFLGLRLGYLHLLSNVQVEQPLKKLGPEPLGINLTYDYFLNRIQSRRGNIKSILINQEIIAGIGNRYSDEIAWQAQILPYRKINELDENESLNLYKSMRFILKEATQYGGYMGNALFVGDTRTGGYNCKMNVYHHEGEACNRCRSLIKRDEIASRKTFYCPNCQS